MVWRILRSPMKVTSKFTIFAYTFTYYAIAFALPLTIGMYVYSLWQDVYHITTFEPWKVFLGVVIVFQVLSPICFSIYRHRIGNEVFWKAWLENIKRSPFFRKWARARFDSVGTNAC